jgi:hypothetical protein
MGVVLLLVGLILALLGFVTIGLILSVVGVALILLYGAGLPRRL